MSVQVEAQALVQARRSRSQRGWAIVTLLVAIPYALVAGAAFFFVQGRQFLAILPPMPAWLLAIIVFHVVVAVGLGVGAIAFLCRRDWAARVLSISGGVLALLALFWTFGMLLYAGITVDAIRNSPVARGRGNDPRMERYYEQGLSTQRALTLESVLPYTVPQLGYGLFLWAFYRRRS